MRINISLAAALLFLAVSQATNVRADLYWDINGATAGGSNSTTAAGTWGTNSFWSTNSAGTVATGAWVANETAVFSAGTNVTGTYDVTLDGTQNISGIRFEEGTVTVTGGTELTIPGSTTTDFNGNGVVDAADYVIWRKNNGVTGTGTQATGDANGDTNVDNTDYNLWRGSFGNVGGATINVAATLATINSTIGGAGRLTKTGAGTLNLTGTNTYTGGTSITAGKLAFPHFSALGTPPGVDTPNHVQISGGATLSNTGTGLEYLVGQFAGVGFGAGAGTIEVADAGAQLAITSTVSGSEKWTKSGPGELQLRNSANPYTAGFRVTQGILVHGALETRAPAAGTLRGSGAQPATVVPDYAILDGGTIRYDNGGAGSTFLASNKGITLGANGGGLMLRNPLDVNGAEILNSNSSISIYFGKISAATATTPTLFKRGKGEIRGDKALLTDPDANDGWDQTKLVVEEGLFRVGHFAEETIFGKVPASYVADAIKLDGRGVARVDGAAAIGVTSGLGEHNAVTTTPATRGIFVEANGGTICTSLGGNRWDIESIISGPGGLNINGNGFPITGAGIYDTASSILRFKGTNTYAGGTIVNSGFLELDGATATLGSGNVTVDGVTVGINGAAAVAAGRLRILSGVSNAIADTAGLSLTGGGTASLADVGYIDLAAGINETVKTLSLNGVGQLAGTYGATGSGAANIMDEYFLGAGMLTVTTASGAGAGIVPEPSTWLLCMAGGAAIGLGRRRR